MDYFVNCDWGTSRFRLRLIKTDTASILAERSSEQGVAKLAETSGVARDERFQEVLSENITALQQAVTVDLNNVPVLISGMASSTMGWRDLPYANSPFSLLEGELPFTRVEGKTPSPIVLFSGLRCERDIMRGEEVELIGWSVLARDFVQSAEEICVVLPGTHSKHVQVQRGVVTSFQTHLTGELYQLLSQRSSLRHSKGEMRFVLRELKESHFDWKTPFQAGIEEVRKHGISGSVFQVRSRQILNGASPTESAAFLSGLLTGGELIHLLNQRESAQQIVLLTTGELQELYLLAFAQLGLSDRVTTISTDDVVRLTALGQRHLVRKIL